ncbi:hypothetical protein [Actinophytocola algeriensis]|uniref:Uncharacterized protein n=1 Tax=Actinophytocola algeriensis TaxID=1768010 RepID=A0A7W7VGC0_9PSEU|nr:hypothetical protein [Actinophytocola algeriensis]MBB4908925.1 hypothetical protein [Actinophytocola algeriensis]MBE1474687.1 hypothetical protein [Actinophytocola algeriensis]
MSTSDMPEPTPNWASRRHSKASGSQPENAERTDTSRIHRNPVGDDALEFRVEITVTGEAVEVLIPGEHHDLRVPLASSASALSMNVGRV